MKVQKIIKMCKDRRMIQTLVFKETQWIGNGSAIYPLYHAPRFDKEKLCFAYDISEKQSSGMMYQELPELKGFCLEDYEEGDSYAEKVPMTIVKNGYTLVPYRTEEGLFFIDKKYLSPFDDEDEVMLYKRLTENGMLYFVAKAGFIIFGIIMPASVVNEDFIQELRALHRECEMIWENSGNKSEIMVQASLID